MSIICGRKELIRSKLLQITFCISNIEHIQLRVLLTQSSIERIQLEKRDRFSTLMVQEKLKQY